jgi:hypothetical protein
LSFVVESRTGGRQISRSNATGPVDLARAAKLKAEFLFHAEGEVLRPARGSDDAIGHRFFEFSFRGA